MMIGLFVVGAGFRTGLAKIISSRILQLAQGKQSLLFILIILVTGFTELLLVTQELWHNAYCD